MKILVRTEGEYEDYCISEILAHPVDHEWTEASLYVEFEQVVQFITPIYQIAENPTPQQLSDGLRTQAAMRMQAIRERWGSTEGYRTAFFKWLTAERGFQPVAWEEV